MRLIDADKLRDEMEVDKYGHIKTTITRLNIAIEHSKVDAVPVVRCKDCKWWCPDNRPEWKPNATDEVKKAAIAERYCEGVEVWGYGNLCIKHLPSDQHEAINFEADEFCNFGVRKEAEDETD